MNSLTIDRCIKNCQHILLIFCEIAETHPTHPTNEALVLVVYMTGPPVPDDLSLWAHQATLMALGPFFPPLTGHVLEEEKLD